MNSVFFGASREGAAPYRGCGGHGLVFFEIWVREEVAVSVWVRVRRTWPAAKLADDVMGDWRLLWVEAGAQDAVRRAVSDVRAAAEAAVL